MEGDDRVRHCSLCQQAVYNLADLSRSEATTLIENATGRVCVRLFRRADGRVITRDCPVGVLRAARRQLATVAGAWIFLVLVAFGWFMSWPGAVRAAKEQVRTVKNWIDPEPPCVMGGPMLMPGGGPPPDEDEDDE